MEYKVYKHEKNCAVLAEKVYINVYFLFYCVIFYNIDQNVYCYHQYVVKNALPVFYYVDPLL